MVACESLSGPVVQTRITEERKARMVETKYTTRRQAKPMAKHLLADFKTTVRAIVAEEGTPLARELFAAEHGTIFPSLQ